MAVAAGAGLAIGLLRGFTLAIEVDHQIDKVRLPRARGSLVLALLLLAAVLLAIVGAFVGTVHTLYREYSPEVAAACAGIFFGRATAIFLRWQRAPYVDLHRT